MQSYDYAHRFGSEEITWDGFAALSANLVEALAKEKVQVVIGIARAGLFPATAVACALRREMYPVRVTRRIEGRVAFDHPIWRVDVPSSDVRGKIVAVVDEIADSGETLALVSLRAQERGAERVVTASLVSHSWASPMPDVTALVSDALVIFPWDKSVYIEGRWQPHPEIAAAIQAQQEAKE
jgi:hypoxanthine phosphoribosyltransferase